MCRRVFRYSAIAQQPPHHVNLKVMKFLVISDYRNIFVVVNFNLPQPTVRELTARREKEILNSFKFRELPRLTFQNDMKKIP